MSRTLLCSRNPLFVSIRGLFGKNSSESSAKLVKPPIPLFGIDGRYATALYSAASKQNQLDSVDKDLKLLLSLTQKDVQFKELLLNPLIKANEKKEIINKSLSKAKLSELTLNLIGVMAENGRIKLLPNVAKSFNRVMAISRGELEVTVTTAKPLDDQARREVEDSLNGFVKGKKLSLTLKVDPNILGGMLVDFAGEHYIDMSIRSKFNFYSNLIRQPV